MRVITEARTEGRQQQEGGISCAEWQEDVGGDAVCGVRWVRERGVARKGKRTCSPAMISTLRAGRRTRGAEAASATPGRSARRRRSGRCGAIARESSGEEDGCRMTMTARVQEWSGVQWGEREAQRSKTSNKRPRPAHLIRSIAVFSTYETRSLPPSSLLSASAQIGAWDASEGDHL